jgi:hypothetical protein
MLRQPADCVHRHLSRPNEADAGTYCELLTQLSGVQDRTLVAVNGQICDACCKFEMPTAESPNPVIASLAYQIARHVIENGSIDDCDARRARALRMSSLNQMETVSSGASRPMEDIVDWTITVETLARHVESGNPFVYLRYSDGEWYSLLGARGTNCDGHDFLPATMGLELESVLSEVSRQPADGSLVYVGTTTSLLQVFIQEYIAANRLTDSVAWVSASLFPLGLYDLSTRRFVEAAAGYSGPKWLVANRHLAPIARALGCCHVVIPERNCYAHIDEIESAMRYRGPGLVLCCASMASECLIWRLFRHNPAATYVDCGSIFDWMIGRENRREASSHRELLRREYFPLFRDYVSVSADR